ncbi:hypothetical protein [Streptomyces sp. NBC_00370]|uniref:hypothetical protein n=1 Tax=Streptomyces sp. NBC_00370 TaxID=2975728 RepID=UPI002E264C9A
MFRESYEDGETLRERLFGQGNARLLDDHPGTRLRDLAGEGRAAGPGPVASAGEFAVQ